MRFLEVHHLKPRSRGGGQEAANLVTLCACCHQLLHERGSLPGLNAAALTAAPVAAAVAEARGGTPSARGSPSP
jgi:hypothetical protein